MCDLCRLWGASAEPKSCLHCWEPPRNHALCSTRFSRWTTQRPMLCDWDFRFCDSKAARSNIWEHLYFSPPVKAAGLGSWAAKHGDLYVSSFLISFSEIQFTGSTKIFRVWSKSKQSKQKGVKNKSISIELEILLFGRVSSSIIRKWSIKNIRKISIHTRINYCISILPERGLKQHDKSKVEDKRQ